MFLGEIFSGSKADFMTFSPAMMLASLYMGKFICFHEMMAISS